jgi:Mrp family chromosome partitioning ATPase
MLKLRNKKRQAPDAFVAPLTISTSGGQQLLTFAPEVVTSVRHMVTGLSCNGGIPASLSVVAALREEGTTYTSLALATVIASDTAASVCAIELNWWSPGMVSLLSAASTGAGAVPSTPRLADILTGKATLDEALLATALPNLSLLPAGEVSLEQRPFMARSEALRELITTLRTRFDYLILDVPAVLATSDAIALASLGAACVVVVRHGLTPRSSVQLALDDLSHLKILGVVLNMAEFHTPKFLRDIEPQE